MTNSDNLNPAVEKDARRGSQTPALEETLMERILCSDNIARAWKQVKRNAGSPGIDRLSVDTEKSKSGHNSKCSFLGFSFYSQGRIRLTDKALQEFKLRVRKLTGRSRFVSIEQRIAQLNLYITGWFNYFGISQYWEPIEELDDWIRRRIPMCLLKQWRYARNKISKLTQLGAPLGRAIANALSPASYWAQARFAAAQMGLTNNYLHNILGLVSLRTL